MPIGSTAEACKLLKGLLNRNPDARWGAAKSKMFEVGGVAGLKQAAFFAKIDWKKLERKELEPPYILKVDNEHDLRNFHDEFTSMPLPRSVKEISMDNMPHRRVHSTSFRGFSFIQPDFKLPERNANDIETYWNSKPEDDGESDSDVASSKCDIGEGVPEAEVEKKKRPPRKRNKKKKNNNNVETASTATSLASEQVLENPKEKADTTTPALVAEQPVPAALSSKVLTEPPKATPLPKPKVEEWQSIESSAAKKNRGTPSQAPPQTTPFQAGTNTRAAALRASTTSWQPVTPQGTLQRPSPPVVQQTPNRLGWAPQRAAATPGSWAARIQTPTPSAASTPSSTRAEPRTPWATASKSTPPPAHSYQRASFSSSQGVPSPSSDWRKHSSPQVQRAMHRSVDEIPSPSSDWRKHTSPQVQRVMHQSVPRSSPNKGAPSWPSLNASPPAPGTGGKTEAASTQGAWASATKNPLQGAWASKATS